MTPLRAASSGQLFAAFLAAAACSAGCETDLERMLHQHKYESFEATSIFSDGKAMRAPPYGTVASDAVLGPAELVSGRKDSVDVARVPLDLTLALLERGENRFQIFCAACHGPLGDGRSPVADAMSLRKPPSLHEPRITSLRAGALFRVISDGYGLMPSYAARLDVHDRWAVVAFVQTLQLSQSVRVAELPETWREEAQPWLE